MVGREAFIHNWPHHRCPQYSVDSCSTKKEVSSSTTQCILATHNLNTWLATLMLRKVHSSPSSINGTSTSKKLGTSSRTMPHAPVQPFLQSSSAAHPQRYKVSSQSICAYLRPQHCASRNGCASCHRGYVFRRWASN